MGNVKRHKSPKTGKGEKCRTDKCPYRDISTAAYSILQAHPLLLQDSLPVAPQLKLSNIGNEWDPATKQTSEYKAITDEVELRVAPAGYTALACGRCGAYMPEGYFKAAQPIIDYNRYMGDKAVPCPNPDCDKLLQPNLNHCDVNVQASDAKYFTNDITVRRDHWFHITTRENWLEAAANGGPNGEAILVHVGSKASALERLRDLRLGILFKSNPNHTTAPDSYYLYEVEVDASAPINPHVMEDAGDSWPEFDRTGDVATDAADELDLQINRAYQPDGITRYLNTVEEPGTVSLMANARRLRQVAVQQIPVEELS